MVSKLNQMSQWMLDQEEPEHFEKNRSQGCIIAYFKFPHPTFSELIAYPEALAALLHEITGLKLKKYIAGV